MPENELSQLSGATFAANAENVRKTVTFMACELRMLQNGLRETKNEFFESLKFRP